MQIPKELKAIQQRVDMLISNGFSVKLYHYMGLNEELNGHKIKAETIFIFYNEHSGAYVEGRATCSKQDVFSVKKGTQIAFSRAVYLLSTLLGRKKVVKIFTS